MKILQNPIEIQLLDVLTVQNKQYPCIGFQYNSEIMIFIIVVLLYVCGILHIKEKDLYNLLFFFCYSSFVIVVIVVILILLFFFCYRCCRCYFVVVVILLSFFLQENQKVRIRQNIGYDLLLHSFFSFVKMCYK